LTSAERPQLAHDAVSMRTPLARMLARVMDGPGGALIGSGHVRFFAGAGRLAAAWARALISARPIGGLPTGVGAERAG
jgi:hypothetical protein